MSDEEYQRWGKSAEEWRCEVCSIAKEILEDSIVNSDYVRDIVELGMKQTLYNWRRVARKS